MDILFHTAFDIDSAAEGTGGVILGAAKDLSPEEVVAFGAPESLKPDIFLAPEVGQHLIRVKLFLDLTAARLADMNT